MYFDAKVCIVELITSIVNAIVRFCLNNKIKIIVNCQLNCLYLPFYIHTNSI